MKIKKEKKKVGTQNTISYQAWTGLVSEAVKHNVTLRDTGALWARTGQDLKSSAGGILL